MSKQKFPGMNNINTDEAAVWVEVFPNASPKELLDFLHGIDDCFAIQKSASIVSRFDGKRRTSKVHYKTIIYERAMRINIPRG